MHAVRDPETGSAHAVCVLAIVSYRPSMLLLKAAGVADLCSVPILQEPDIHNSQKKQES